MDALTIIYLVYSFISFYFLIFFMLIFIPRRKDIHETPPITKEYPLTMIVSCYNEKESIGEVIECLLESDYKNLKRIVVVDDCSKDGSWKVIQKYASKYPEKILAVQTPKNTGNAAGAKNFGAKYADTELIGFTDADSYPEKESIPPMIGHFDDEKVGAVTSMILVKNKKKFLEKVQAIEYKMIAFNRKLLGYVDAIYVTPGPLAIYRRSAFQKIGGFDHKNLTEDIEITSHLVAAGYKVKMSTTARVYTIAPSKIKMWIKQRIRWNIGGIQTINKYKKHFFNAGMLGYWILPYFIFNWILGVVGILTLGYRVSRTIFLRYLTTSYSVNSEVAVMTFSDINLTPSILVFFGIATIIMNFFLVSIALVNAKEKTLRKERLYNILFYMFFYLLAYPIILFTSIFKFLTGKVSWGTK